MNNQYCSAHKTIPYNLVFGQLPHSETRLADILINNNYEQEELFNNDNESYDYLSILDDYYNQDKLYNQTESLLYNRNPNNSFADDFESKLNLEDSIISNNNDYDLNDWNNNDLIDSLDNIINSQETIIFSSDSESQSYHHTAQEKENGENHL
ncbi:12882_t:CDS:1 [Racocetra fulgida]|uniref:12882_t:CDS:1 n=1 Tax=Racocetra fulgida TaxID=60492 RepID=A0A9N9DI92_9GLOM|nr:12882_t:CDS:1 [Racocetra fulgida]